jgi:hypothetical protein
LLGLSVSSNVSLAKGFYETKFDINTEEYTRAKIINNSNKALACYIAIDGYKVKFNLLARQHSKWYKATDKQLTYTAFSSHCNHIKKHNAHRLYN